MAFLSGGFQPAEAAPDDRFTTAIVPMDSAEHFTAVATDNNLCETVVAAVIRNSEKVFATSRGYGEFKGKWEFPGGKIEKDETPQQALIREIKEELNITIKVKKFITTLEYDYPSFHLSMDCFWAEIISGELILKEAEASKWLVVNELDSVQWLPADIKILPIIKKVLTSR